MGCCGTKEAVVQPEGGKPTVVGPELLASPTERAASGTSKCKLNATTTTDITTTDESVKKYEYITRRESP